MTSNEHGTLLSNELMNEIYPSIEDTVLTTNAMANTISFSLEEYQENVGYAIFLVSDYEVYQVFSKNIETGITTSDYVYKITGEPYTAVYSSESSTVQGYFDIEDYSLAQIDMELLFSSVTTVEDTTYYNISNEGQ